MAAAVALALLAGGAAALHFWENDRYATGSDEVGSAVIAAPEEQKEITYDGSTYRQRSGLRDVPDHGHRRQGQGRGRGQLRGRRTGRRPDGAGGGRRRASRGRCCRSTATPSRRCRCWMFWAGWRRMPTSRSRWPIITAMAGRSSCENTALAVSMLLDDQPIDGYFAVEHGRGGHRHRPCGGRDPDRHLGFLRDRPHAGAGRRGDAGRREGADLCAQPPPHRRPDQHRPHGPSAAVPRRAGRKAPGSRTASSQPKPIRRWRTTW